MGWRTFHTWFTACSPTALAPFPTQAGRRPRDRHSGGRAHEQRRALQPLQGRQARLRRFPTLKAKSRRDGPNRWERLTQRQRHQQAPRHEKAGGGQGATERNSKQWYSCYNTNMYTQERTAALSSEKDNDRSANFASQPSCPPDLGAREPPSPRYGSDCPCISFTAVGAPAEEDQAWPFGPTDKPAASLGHSARGDGTAGISRLFEAFGGITGEESGGAAFMAEGGTVGLRGRINGVLAAVVCALAMVVVAHDMWPSMTSSLYGRVVSNRQQTARHVRRHDRRAGRADPDGRSGRNKVLLDTGASGRYLDGVTFQPSPCPRLWRSVNCSVSHTSTSASLRSCGNILGYHQEGGI